MAIDANTSVCETVSAPRRRAVTHPRRATASWPTTGPAIESIVDGGQTLAMIIRSQTCPDKTTFVTQPEWKQQVGFVVYPAGGEIARHVHRPLERHLVGTSEVLVVKQGR